MNPRSDHDNTINILFSQKKNSKSINLFTTYHTIVTVIQTFQTTNLSDGFLHQMKLPGSIWLLNIPIDRPNNIKRQLFPDTQVQTTQINSHIFVHLKEIACVCNVHYLSNCLEIRKQANISELLLFHKAPAMLCASPQKEKAIHLNHHASSRYIV